MTRPRRGPRTALPEYQVEARRRGSRTPKATWSALFQPEEMPRPAQGTHCSRVSSAAAYWLAVRVADRISWVTSSGWVISERWPESISTVVAFMRLARKRSSSGEVVRSRREMAYQDGFDRQAAAVVLSRNRDSETRPCTA